VYRRLFARYTHVVSDAPNDAGEYAAICHLHGDNKPSLSFNGKTGQWYCFACNTGGTAETFIARTTGMSVSEARRVVATVISPASQDDIERWCQNLKQAATPLAYLQQRGLLHWPTLEKYRIGYDGERITIPV